MKASALSLTGVAVSTPALLLFTLCTRDLPSPGADLPAIASFCTACAAPSLTQLAAALAITHCSYPITPSTTVASRLRRKVCSSSSPPLTHRIEPRRFDGRAFFTWASFFISRRLVAPAALTLSDSPAPSQASSFSTPSLLRGPLLRPLHHLHAPNSIYAPGDLTSTHLHRTVATPSRPPSQHAFFQPPLYISRSIIEIN